MILVAWLCVLQVEAQDIPLKPINGKTKNWSQAKGSQATVLIFMSPECPLCKNYSLTLNKLYQQYKGQGIAFYGIFPGKDYPRKQIKAFLQEYNIAFEALSDPNYVLTQKFAAGVTPQVFVLDSNRQLVYQGGIDNWAYDLGKQRRKITEHYLNDALEATLAGTEPAITTTKAIGCLIYVRVKEDE